MGIASWLGGIKSARGRRTARIFIALCSLMAVTTPGALARYDWCARDPVLTFYREDSLLGLVPEHVLDVQVWINNGQVSVDDVEVTLNVTIPENIQGVDTLALVTEPAFKIKTVFHEELKPVDSQDYGILIEADIPATHGEFATELMITSASGQTLDLVKTCAGQAGKPLRAKVDLASFAVACQEETNWISVDVSQ